VPDTLFPSEAPAAPVNLSPTLATIAPSAATPAPAPSTLPRITGYEILGELGRGGMGVVYKARDYRLNRVVALKMMLSGAHAGPQERLRFQIEAETVAGLDHPNIIKIHEIGEHAGCPYLALEYLEGRSLDHYLTEHKPTPDEAARIIETVARAIHHAHLNGVVHRDLKPSNIFLTRDGTLRILDFGLAKRQESGTQTQSGAVLGTPHYMAPEQAGGNTRHVSPAADVWALGAILYEMLAGQPPFRGDTLMNTLLKVQNQEPLAPSRLHARLPRDLDVICLKCLRKEPKSRYVSSEALADDLRRFRTGEPIQARPVPAWERAIKWARRRPTAAALVLVSVAGLVAFLAVGFWVNARLRRANEELRTARDRAEKRSRLARTAVDDMYVQVAERWLDEEEDKDDLQREFLEKALRIYEELAKDEGDDPSLRRATALAHFRTGQIYRALERPADAEKAYDEAIRMQEELVRQDTSNADYRQDLANTFNYRGELLRLTERAEQALPWYDRALDLQKELSAVSDNPTYRKEQARSYYNRGLALRMLNRPGDALEAFAQAHALLEPLNQRDPKEPSYAQELARVHLNRGAVLMEEKRYNEAIDADLQAIRLQTELTRLFPGKPEYRHELAVSRNNLANAYWSKGQAVDALQASEEARSLLKQLADAHPGRPVYRYDLANALNTRGSLLSGTDPERARQDWEESRRLFAALSERSPGRARYHFGVGQAQGNLGWLYLWKLRQPAEALPLLEAAVANLDKACGCDNKTQQYRQPLGFVSGNLAEARLRLGKHVGAAEAVEFMLNYGLSVEADRFNAARYFARCLSLCERPRWWCHPDSAAERQEHCRYYSRRAVEELGTLDPDRFQMPRTSAAMNALRGSPGVGVGAVMRVPPGADPVFEGLRGRDDFAAVAQRWDRPRQQP
jgi:tetratricopeptide (TPR) repeat protein/tRNA A-37 threonylcarbamoyl transferase component Bud32